MGSSGIFQERFCTIERVFAWEDKFRRLLLRFERISSLHYSLKTLAHTMINLRHFCRGLSSRRLQRTRRSIAKIAPARAREKRDD
jgi:hypothetical protein